MEYVEGVDLQRLVDEDGPLDCDLAVDYIRQAADGLDHAHQQNMIHCDIKPSKLLVNMQGVVKILDLGLAWLSDGGPAGRRRPGASRTSDAVDYLAPEQTLEGGKPDGRADIYSLGCTLYFLLTGHPPFPPGDAAGTNSQTPNAGAAGSSRRAAQGSRRAGRDLQADDGEESRRIATRRPPR